MFAVCCYDAIFCSDFESVAECFAFHFIVHVFNWNGAVERALHKIQVIQYHNKVHVSVQIVCNKRHSA
jgi:tetrahydromethanopterin S-methyltransferase subunit E